MEARERHAGSGPAGEPAELPPITSSQNRQLSLVRRLIAKPRECRREGVLVADGIHLVQEALKAGLNCRALFLTVSERQDEIGALVEEAARRRLPVYRVLDHLFRTFSPVETPEGALGVFERPGLHGGKLWAGPSQIRGHLAVAHQIQDPSNLGALTRSALAAGFSGLITSPGTVDPFHHRALRASMGAAFHLPIRTDQPPGQLISTFRNLGYRTIALSPRAELDLTELDPAPPSVLFLGSEGSGLDPAVERNVDCRVRIPMQSGVESLGVAAAGAVAFFWLKLASRNGHLPRA